MNETTKTRKLWGQLERSILSGKGIDIGCGPDPVTPDVHKFDQQNGDANQITKYVHEEFDFVFSSHCLEHMRNPREAILEWWKLVRPGGHLFFIVPDEDLYEQGVFPSRFNSDHKATFTIAKAKSWSPVSINVLDLVHLLPGAQLVSLALQDACYDRRKLKYGRHSLIHQFVRRVYAKYFRSTNGSSTQEPTLPARVLRRFLDDQTVGPDAVAQIQCIVKKMPSNSSTL
jgi:SAM-dependent methyltransferase